MTQKADVGIVIVVFNFSCNVKFHFYLFSFFKIKQKIISILQYFNGAL